MDIVNQEEQHLATEFSINIEKEREILKEEYDEKSKDQAEPETKEKYVSQSQMEEKEMNYSADTVYTNNIDISSDILPHPVTRKNNEEHMIPSGQDSLLFLAQQKLDEVKCKMQEHTCDSRTPIGSSIMQRLHVL
eukprot:11743956-Ditylum_brightwellii.AAC.1